jgi:hypothetical protein
MALTFGQDLDAMIEARNAAEWEEINEEREIDADEIEYQMDECDDDLENALTDLAEAINAVEGLPEENRIRSIFEDLTSVRNDVAVLKKKILEAVKIA